MKLVGLSQVQRIVESLYGKIKVLIKAEEDRAKSAEEELGSEILAVDLTAVRIGQTLEEIEFSLEDNYNTRLNMTEDNIENILNELEEKGSLSMNENDLIFRDGEAMSTVPLVNDTDIDDIIEMLE